MGRTRGRWPAPDRQGAGGGRRPSPLGAWTRGPPTPHGAGPPHFRLSRSLVQPATHFATGSLAVCQAPGLRNREGPGQREPSEQWPPPLGAWGGLLDPPPEPQNASPLFQSGQAGRSWTPGPWHPDAGHARCLGGSLGRAGTMADRGWWCMLAEEARVLPPGGWARPPL